MTQLLNYTGDWRSLAPRLLGSQLFQLSSLTGLAPSSFASYNWLMVLVYTLLFLKMLFFSCSYTKGRAKKLNLRTPNCR